MGKMYFYDISMLYDRYEDYVNKENEEQEKQQQEYEDKYQEYQNIDPGSMMRSVSNQMPNYNIGGFNADSITKGFM